MPELMRYPEDMPDWREDAHSRERRLEAALWTIVSLNVFVLSGAVAFWFLATRG